MKIPSKTYVYFIAFVILTLIISQDRILDELESNLVAHMIPEHGLFFITGALTVLVAENVLKIIKRYENRENLKTPHVSLVFIHLITKKWIKLVKLIFNLNRYGLVWAGMALVLIIFWHLPAIFNLATESAIIHLLQHISFIVVGASMFLAVRSLKETFVMLFLFSMMGMMGLMGLVFVLLDERFYLFYTVGDHNMTGDYMIAISILLLVVVFPAYILRRSLQYTRSKTKVTR